MNDNILEHLLKKAKEHEKKYEWLQAAEYYKKASDLTRDNDDVLKVAKLQEHIGFCFNRAAFQIKTTMEYKRRINKAIEAYKKAVIFYNLSTKEEKKTKIIRTRATILSLSSLITTDLNKKEELINESLVLEKTALEIYKKADDNLGVGRVCNTLIGIISAR